MSDLSLQIHGWKSFFGSSNQILASSLLKVPFSMTFQVRIIDDHHPHSDVIEPKVPELIEVFMSFINHKDL